MVSGGQSLRDDECLRCIPRSLNRRLLSGRQAGQIDRPVLNLPRLQLEVTLKGARRPCRMAAEGRSQRTRRPRPRSPVPEAASSTTDAVPGARWGCRRSSLSARQEPGARPAEPPEKPPVGDHRCHDTRSQRRRLGPGSEAKEVRCQRSSSTNLEPHFAHPITQL